MSRLYEALTNAQAQMPAAAGPPVRRKLPVVDDVAMLKLAQSIDTRLAHRPSRVIQFVGCDATGDVKTLAARLARLSAATLRRPTILLDATVAPLLRRPQHGHPAVAGMPAIPALEPAQPDSGEPHGQANLFDVIEDGKADPLHLRRSWERLRDDYELSVIASPPITHAIGLAIAPTVDGVVLVIEADRTKAGRAQAARDALIASGANVLGVVLDKRRYWIPPFLWKLV